MRAWLGAALICAFGAAVAGAEGEARPPVELEAERLLRQLADPNLRDRAIDRLAALGPRARPALERATHDADPDVRFNALYLLELEDVDLRRAIRVIVEGNGVNSGTYDEARDAYFELLGTLDEAELQPAELQRRADLRGMLVRYVLRQARRGAEHIPDYSD